MSSMMLGFLMAVVGIIVVAVVSASSWRRKRPVAASQPQDGEESFIGGILVASGILAAANILFLLFFNELAVVMWERQWLWMILIQAAAIIWKILRLTEYGYYKWVLYILVVLGGFFKMIPTLTDEQVMTAAVRTGQDWEARTSFVLSKLGVSQVGSVRIETPRQLPSAPLPRLPRFKADSSQKKSAAPKKNGVRSVEVPLDSTKWTSVASLGEFKNGDWVLVERVSGIADSLTLRIGGVPGGKCQPLWDTWCKIHTTDTTAVGTGELWTNRQGVTVRVSRK